jgi:hypothetical protein
MLSLPSAVAGLILGIVLAELLVPAITLTSAATAPVLPALPVLAAGLTIVRRPDAAAVLRAAESA